MFREHVPLCRLISGRSLFSLAILPRDECLLISWIFRHSTLALFLFTLLLDTYNHGVRRSNGDMLTINMFSWPNRSYSLFYNSVGKNKKLSKRGGTKKRAVDAFARKDWYQLKAPTFFSQRDLGRTPVNRSQGLSEYYCDIRQKQEKKGRQRRYEEIVVHDGRHGRRRRTGYFKKGSFK